MSIPPIPKKLPKLPPAAAAKIPTAPKRPNLPGSSTVPKPVPSPTATPASPAPARPRADRAGDVRAKAGQLTGAGDVPAAEQQAAPVGAGAPVAKTTLKQDVKDAALGTRSQASGERLLQGGAVVGLVNSTSSPSSPSPTDPRSKTSSEPTSPPN